MHVPKTNEKPVIVSRSGDLLGDGLKIFPCDNLWKPESFCLVAGDRIISTHNTKAEAEAKRQHILHAPCSENLRTAGRPVSLPNFQNVESPNEKLRRG